MSRVEQKLFSRYVGTEEPRYKSLAEIYLLPSESYTRDVLEANGRDSSDESVMHALRTNREAVASNKFPPLLPHIAVGLKSCFNNAGDDEKKRLECRQKLEVQMFNECPTSMRECNQFILENKDKSRLEKLMMGENPCSRYAECLASIGLFPEKEAIQKAGAAFKATASQKMQGYKQENEAKAAAEASAKAKAAAAAAAASAPAVAANSQ
mmetsp:Transcript_19281/g.49000  ORF Transcript_19281/g.49000 Transcript_19281/m.49000 type:complete len:210 (+) Transcript_19281:42-671(+)|eukprot:CAMPEP_0177654018 /NCGR_PEP_ID=MMETSP0447-20121125/14071_1 /TAXON_ID=0 /ORGANISM="Stygamoeba regulata, Strain BSH-02190019" /LENGTH=209 /DNA_ID=CAMNT_0019157565 /DNA_START=42 /DNA_END=671 /DNA_ORIENTATION=+